MFPRTPDLLTAICNEIKLKEWKDSIEKEAKNDSKTGKKFIIKTNNKKILEVMLDDTKEINISVKIKKKHSKLETKQFNIN